MPSTPVTCLHQTSLPLLAGLRGGCRYLGVRHDDDGGPGSHYPGPLHHRDIQTGTYTHTAAWELRIRYYQFSGV